MKRAVYWVRLFLIVVVIANLCVVMGAAAGNDANVVPGLEAALFRPFSALQAATDATLTAVTPPGSYSVGQTINVNLVVNVTKETRSSSVSLRFDPALLRCDGITEGTFYSSWAASRGAQTFFSRGAINNTAGTVGESYVLLLGGPTPTPSVSPIPSIPSATPGPIFFMPGVTGTGILMTFRFTALANGISPIDMPTATVSDNHSQILLPLTLTVVNGQVIVGPTPAASLTPTRTPTRTLTPTLTPTPTPTRTPYPTPDLSVVCPAADLNHDGYVDVLDLQQITSRFGQTGAPGWIPEDVNHDGKVDIGDVVYVSACVGRPLTPVPTPAPQTAVISISPVQQTVKSGQTLMVDLLLNVNARSTGASAGLRFNPAVLRCVSVDEGNFYKSWVAQNYPSAQTQITPTPQCDNVTGQVSPGGVYLTGSPPGQGPSGSGSLFRILFTAVGTGTATLQVSNAQVRDNSIPISKTLVVTTLDGNVNVQAGGPNVAMIIQPAEFRDLVVNQTIDFTINITSDTPTRGAQAGLSFDPSILDCSSVKEGTFYKDWAAGHGANTTFFPPASIDNDHGQISLAVVAIIGGTGGATGSGPFLSISCRVVGSGGNSALILTDFVVSDASGTADALPLQIYNGWIGPIAVPTATPTATRSPTATAPAGRLYLDPASPIVRPGTNFDLDMKIDIPVASSGMQFEASFDKNIIECLSIERGTFYDNWVDTHPSAGADVVDIPSLPSCNNTTGKINLGGISLIRAPNGQGPTGGGVVYKLHFKALANGASTIALSNVIVSDSQIVQSGGNESTNPIPVSISGSQVTVSTTAASLTPTIQASVNATGLAQTQTAGAIQTQTAAVSNNPNTTAVAQTQTQAAALTVAASGGGGPAVKATPVPTKSAAGSLSVSPVQKVLTAPGDDVFDIDLVLTIDKPTRGMQVKVKYDPAVLTCVKIIEGNFYKDFAKQYSDGKTLLFPSPKCNDAEGTVLGISLLGGPTPNPNFESVGATGSGVVFTIQFKAKKVGSSEISLSEVIISDNRSAIQANYGIPIINGGVYIGVTPPPSPTPLTSQGGTTPASGAKTVTPTVSGTPRTATPGSLTPGTGTPSSTVQPGQEQTKSSADTPITGAPPVPYDLSDKVDEQGILTEDVEFRSEDGILIIRLVKGTQVLTAENRRLKEITIRRLDSYPAPENNFESINLAYELGPEGATFDPPALISMAYEQADLPENTKTKDLALTLYDPSKEQWIQMKGKLDEDHKELTASVPHFSIYSLMIQTSIIPRGVWIGTGVLLGLLLAAGVIFYIRRRRAGQKNALEEPALALPLHDEPVAEDKPTTSGTPEPDELSESLS